MSRKLVCKNLLVPEGLGRGTRYALPGNAGSAANEGSSLASGGSSLANEGSSLANEGSSLAGGDAVEHVKTSRRAPVEVVEQAILVLCEADFRTPGELALALNRSAKRLKDIYLPPLVARGVLEPRFPDKPTHRNQAYRVVKPR